MNDTYVVCSSCGPCQEETKAKEEKQVMYSYYCACQLAPYLNSGY